MNGSICYVRCFCFANVTLKIAHQLNRTEIHTFALLSHREIPLRNKLFSNRTSEREKKTAYKQSAIKDQVVFNSKFPLISRIINVS